MRGIGKLVCVIALAACGGPSDSPPGPLPKHFDDMYIAAIPLDQKQSVVQTQNDWSIAKMEQAKAEADFNETTTQLQIARNDRQQAHLQVDSAVSQKKSAEASADLNRINNAQKDLHTAEDTQKAALERVKYLEAYRNYMQQYVRYTQENTYWHEAQYEQAKAKLAQGNNIAPKNVNYSDYPSQLEQRQKRTQSAKEKAEKGKAHVVEVREGWIKIQHQSDVESGKQSSQWDPMAPNGGTPVGETKPLDTKPMPAATGGGAGGPGGAGSAPTPSGGNGSGAGSGSGSAAQ
jgi:hypothetical protein